MFLERINEQLPLHGFERMNLTQQGIFGFVKQEEEQNSCVIFINLPDELPKNVWSIRYSEQQVKAEIYFEGVAKFLFVYITDEPDKIRCLCEDNFDAHWIIARNERKLLIYENQLDNYCNMKDIIEGVLVENKPQKKITAFGTIGILGINVLIYVIMYWLCTAEQRNELIDNTGLFWPAVTYNHEYFRIVTSMFIHSGINHLINNMVLLYCIGSYVEDSVGHVKFMLLYFVSGILAGVVSMSYNIINNQLILSIGASGAIFGIVGALACFIFLSKGMIKDITAPRLIFFIFLSISSGLYEQDVDNMAHFGGLLSGFLLALILMLLQKRRLKKPKTR
nr:rhomboid family intramembrane serine protease [uncultured Lachnoclostridium sp.]